MNSDRRSATPAYESLLDRSAYRPEIDGLRAIAVLSVIFFHAGISRFASGGFVGVDVFFVISGYLITRLLTTEISRIGTIDFVRFYERRIRRLFPALSVVFLLTFAGAAVLFTADHMHQFAGSLLSALASVSNIYFWAQAGYFDTDSHFKPLLHTWSLSVEEQFYLIWPAILALAGARRWWLALAGLFAASLIANVVYAPGGQATIFYLMPFRIFEFAIGASVLWLERFRLKEGILSEILLLTGLALIGYAVVFFDKDITFPSTNALIPCVGSALVIAFGRAKYSGLLLRNRASVWTGLISYSLYLVHWPIIVFYRYITVSPLNDTGRTAVVILSFLLAAALYRFVEQPFRHRDSRFWRPRKQFLATCALLAAVLAGTSVTALSGWQWRLTDTTHSALSSATHSALSIYGGTDCAKPRCEHGDSGRPVYVVGESFARQLYEGLITTFPRQKFVVLDYGDCTFFSPKWIRWVEADHVEAACVAERDKLFQELRTKKPRVILANNWERSKYFDADYFEETGGELRLKRLHADGERAGFIVAEIEKLRTVLGLDVLVVGNPPSIGSLSDLDVCLFRPLQINRRSCDAAPIGKVSGRRVLALTAKSRLLVIDPFEAFCDDKSCRNYSADGLYYSDKEHLSKLGSQLLIAHFKSELNNWMSE